VGTLRACAEAAGFALAIGGRERKLMTFSRPVGPVDPLSGGVERKRERGFLVRNGINRLAAELCNMEANGIARPARH